MLKLRCCWLCFFMITGIFFVKTQTVFAQDVSVEARVDADKVSVGQRIQLTIAVRNAKPVSEVKLSPIEGFEAAYLGPSTRVTVVNGRYSSITAYVYSLLALKEGKFQIPSVAVEVKGKTFATKPIDIDVVEGLAARPQKHQQESPQEINDKIFLTLEVSKTNVYQDEKVPVSIKLFNQGQAVKNIQIQRFGRDGFEIDEFSEPKKYKQVIAGTSYEVTEFQVDVYPRATGELTLGPASVRYETAQTQTDDKNSQGSNGDEFGKFFDDPLFDQFFGADNGHFITIESPEQTIRVWPVPEKGQT